MAITKKFKVSFVVKAVITNEMEGHMAENMVRIAKAIQAGEKVSFQEREFLVQCLTHGPDGGAAFALRTSLRERVRESFLLELLKVSPATVEVIK